ncbi:Glycoside hydrolase family 76 protein [Mycena venus]|uniref:Glycoside hydrolase family 76 protein n=1 Tax=Mycena venus TaxID=2733690 RepID=A0A8H6YY16_9AGAR|nr:Glycoside hydrolase family 76 protein [Mycena venus]
MAYLPGYMESFLFFIGLLLLTAIHGASQVASPSWRKSNITTSRAERVRLASAALDISLNRLGGDGQFPDDPFAATGNLYSQLALFDLATNQTNFVSNAVIQGFDRTGESLTFGHAAAKAYIAYKKPIFLQYAIQSWWNGRKWTLSVQDIAAGKFAGKSFPLTKACQNASMVGGTWVDIYCLSVVPRHSHVDSAQFDNDSGDSKLEGYATGYFMGLSALLAEITSDPVYLQAATESANFIRAHLYDVRNIVQPDISASTKDSPCEVFTDTTPFESGLMIESLSVLSSITNDTSWQKLLDDLLTAAIPNFTWQGEDGIVAVHGQTGDVNLLQGLGAAYSRNTTSAAMHQYIGDYIAVQFNAVVDLATVNGTNIYSGSWTGPPSPDFSGNNQTMALAALISAISVDGNSVVSAAPPTASPPPCGEFIVVGRGRSGSPQRKSEHLTPIVGGALGGIVAVLLLFALWYLRKRGSRSRKNPTDPPINPFPVQETSTVVFSKGEQYGDQRNGSHRGAGQDHSAVDASSPINPSAPADSYLEDGRVEIPADELVTVLNQWLQNRQRNLWEAPPEYPATDASP